MPEQMVRRGDFMTKPKEGWLHDQTLLNHGAGVYYAFPVKYVGSIQVLQSLSKVDPMAKIDICCEAIMRCGVAAKLKKAGKQKKLDKSLKGFLNDVPYVKPMDLKINLSTDGIATADLQNASIISFDGMKKISFAAGGTGNFYNWITYVAKDKKDNRYCHVFDCGPAADDVLATVGQVFTIMIEKKKPRSASIQPSDEAMNPMYFDMGAPGQGVPPPLPEGHPSAGGPPPLPGGHPSMRPRASIPIATEQLTYDDEAQPEYSTMDAPQAMENDMYDNFDGQTFQTGSQFVQHINATHASNHIYGDEALYGDGDAGWNYLDVKPEEEEMYGNLADLAIS